MSAATVSIFLLVGIFFLMTVGVPLAFAAGSLAVIVAYVNFGTPAISLAHKTVYGLATEYSFLAVPMFILMASLLERSRLARDLYDSLNSLVGRVRGGIAYVTLFISIILAAISGIIGGEIVLLGLVALPQMLRLKYNRNLAIGIVCAGGSLGTMIPPSIVLIIYGLTANVSIHQLFLGSFFPGFLLAMFYMIYIAVRVWLDPTAAPKPDSKKDSPFLWKPFLRGIIGPTVLIVTVFGCIYGGITSITEAANIAVAMTIVIIAIRGELTVALVAQALTQTLRACGIILWVTFGAAVMVAVYNLSGGQKFVTDLILNMQISPYLTVLLMMGIFLVLGLFMDWIGILLLCMPIFVPIITALGFDPVWFGVLFSVTMQVAFLSPPFGPAAFYLKSVVPPEITLSIIYRALWPFMLIQIGMLLLLLAFPQIALWIPRLLQ